MKRWIDTIVAVVIGAALVGIVALTLVNTGRINENRDAIEQVERTGVTYRYLLDLLAGTGPSEADSLRKALGVPPPEVTEALDSLRARLDSLEAR